MNTMRELMPRNLPASGSGVNGKRVSVHWRTLWCHLGRFRRASPAL